MEKVLHDRRFTNDSHGSQKPSGYKSVQHLDAGGGYWVQTQQGHPWMGVFYLKGKLYLNQVYLKGKLYLNKVGFKACYPGPHYSGQVSSINPFVSFKLPTL